MFENSIQSPTHSKGPYESRVDHCGQSYFEVWLPTSGLEALEVYFDEDLQQLEARFGDFMTEVSLRPKTRKAWRGEQR